MELDNLSTREQKQLEKIISKTRKEQEIPESEEVRLTVIPESKTKTESQLKNERRIKNLENSVTTLAEVMTDLVEQDSPNRQEKTGQQQKEQEEESEDTETEITVNENNLELTPSEKEVYEQLTKQYKSSNQLSDETGYHQDTIKKAYYKLVEAGLAETATAKGVRLKHDEDEVELSQAAQRVYDALTHEYKTSQEIAEETGMHATTIRQSFPELKTKGLVKTKMGAGIKKIEEGKTVSRTMTPDRVECKLCGQTFQTKGFTQHIRRTEGVEFKPYFKTDEGTYRTDTYNVERDNWDSFRAALNKTQGLPRVTEIVAENLIEIKDYHQGESEEKESESEEESIDEEDLEAKDFQSVVASLPNSEVDRIDLLRQLSTNFYKVMDDIAEESGQPEADSAYYLEPFKEYNLVDMKRRAGTRLTDKGRLFLEWYDNHYQEEEEESVEESENDSSTVSDDESFQGEDELEKGELEELLASTSITDRDFQIATLAFEKIINRQEKDFVSYHLFEQNFEGDNIKPMRFFQKMFSNPEMVQHLMDGIGEERDWTWSKKQDFKDGMKNWVIELK